VREKIDEIIEFLKSELAEDCSYYSGKVFGSMSSYPDDDVVRVFAEFIEKNAGDANIFAGTAKIENKVINLLGTFFNNPTAGGNCVSGGSEANVVGLWAARNFFKEKKNLPFLNEEYEIIVPETRHTSIAKAADLLNLKLVEVPVNNDFEVETKIVEEKISEKTIAIVGIAGNTVYGAIDNIEDLSIIALNNNCWLHVDAAFGGFAIPFLKNPPKFDFILEGVKSLVADPHKNLGSPIPNGCILFRDLDYSKHIIHHLPYFSGKKTENRTIIGTKSGAAIIATYYILNFKGIDWLKKRMKSAFENKDYLKQRLEELGFEVLGKAQLNVLAAKPPDNMRKRRNELFKKGWRIGKYGDLWRFVVMPTIRREYINELISVLEENC